MNHDLPPAFTDAIDDISEAIKSSPYSAHQMLDKNKQEPSNKIPEIQSQDHE